MSRKFWNRLAFERELWLKGILCVAGVDEAGCGPLAGPVVAAAVQFPCTWADAGLPSKFRGLNDSKQLMEEEREKFYALITTREDIRYAVSVVNADVIDQINILQAAHRAMNQALEQLIPTPQHALVDGRPVKSLRVPHTPLVKGDARSYSIAAASVLAKVTRDRLMVEYDRQFPGYGFGEHKGYGTPQHLAAIRALGPSPIHRLSFSPLRPVELELFQEETASSASSEPITGQDSPPVPLPPVASAPSTVSNPAAIS